MTGFQRDVQETKKSASTRRRACVIFEADLGLTAPKPESPRLRSTQPSVAPRKWQWYSGYITYRSTTCASSKGLGGGAYADAQRSTAHRPATSPRVHPSIAKAGAFVRNPNALKPIKMEFRTKKGPRDPYLTEPCSSSSALKRSPSIAAPESPRGAS
ncbi:hypothetical protein ANO14919_079170 [Xylariales sp. No.14919]|nr:hypothetical protein ANO14919_079170 [Xylariales sp. No.14919]